MAIDNSTQLADFKPETGKCMQRRNAQLTSSTWRRSCAMRRRNSRLSISICFSPMPRVRPPAWRSTAHKKQAVQIISALFALALQQYHSSRCKMPFFALGLPRTSLTDQGTAMGCAHNASTYESAGAAGSPAAPGAPDANDPWFRPCTHACMVRGSMCRCPSEARKHAYLQLAFLGLGRLRKYVND